MYSSFRTARLEISDGKRFDLPEKYNSLVSWSANVFIIGEIVTCNVTHVNKKRNQQLLHHIWNKGISDFRTRLGGKESYSC